MGVHVQGARARHDLVHRHAHHGLKRMKLERFLAVDAAEQILPEVDCVRIELEGTWLVVRRIAWPSKVPGRQCREGRASRGRRKTLLPWRFFDGLRRLDGEGWLETSDFMNRYSSNRVSGI